MRVTHEVRALIPSTSMTAVPLNAAETALIQAMLALTARLDVRQTCTAMLDAVQRSFDARACWILLHDPTTIPPGRPG